MITSLRQRKIKCKPRLKIKHNILHPVSCTSFHSHGSVTYTLTLTMMRLILLGFLVLNPLTIKLYLIPRGKIGPSGHQILKYLFWRAFKGKPWPFVSFRSKDSVGWELIFSTPYLENCVEKMALNAKVTSSSLGDKMLAVSSGKYDSICIFLCTLVKASTVVMMIMAQ